MDSYFDELERLARHASGSKKNSTAIVIPSGADFQMLGQHLQKLSKQSKRNFDIIILGKMPQSAPQGINIIRYSEEKPLGSSGSFSIGQMLGYKLGYDFVINADIDCFPASDDLVERLVQTASREGKAVLPLSDEEGKKEVYCINRYGIVPRRAMEKIGFEYAIFFKGAEDIDYQLRLEFAGLLMTAQDLKTTHPYLSMVLFEVASRGPKYLYYYRAGLAILSLSLYRSLTNFRAKESILCAGRLLYSYCFNFAFSAAASRVIFRIMLDAFLVNFSSRYEGLEFSIPKSGVKEGASPLLLEVGGGSNKGTVYFGEWKELSSLGKAARRVSQTAKLFGLAASKGDYFKPSGAFIEKYGFFIPYLMFMKPVYYKGSFYGWGKGTLSLLAGVLLMLFTLPLFPFIAAFSLLKIWQRGDYPPNVSNIGRMLKNFKKIIS